MAGVPMQKTEQCVSDEALWGYVREALPAEHRTSLEVHLASCLSCLSRSAAVHRLAKAARRATCARIVPQLPAYLQARMRGEDIETVRAHLLVCPGCFDRYDQLVEAQMVRAWERWGPTAQPRSGRGAQRSQGTRRGRR